MMNITVEQLLAVFANYNLQIWPMQILAYLLGLVALLLAFRNVLWATRVIVSILAFFWIWVGLLFWLPSARQGFTLGYAFSAMFVLEGVLFLKQAVKPTLSFGTDKKSQKILGLIFILYTMVGYPLLGLLIGHTYPHTPPFGLAPCPLIIFSFGIFLLATSQVSILLLAIPFIYGLSGIIWVSKGMWEDIGLIISSLIGSALILHRNKQIKAMGNKAKSDHPKETWSLKIS